MKVLSGSLETGNSSYLFKDVELTLYEDGWTCLLGPSGVGKTTLLRLLAGLDVHGSFSGHLSSVDAAYMAQQDLLFPWLNVAENVVLGARLRGEESDPGRAAQLIESVGLSEHSEKYPRQLSGGMRQRAALARTLMEDRATVLLDEPFSALDAKTRAEMQELAHGLLRNKTVLLVTHDPLEAARLGDEILLLDDFGLRQMNSKTDPKILDAGSAETLALQAELLTVLRKEAA